jgi:hypothetical protein
VSAAAWDAAMAIERQEATQTALDAKRWADVLHARQSEDGNAWLRDPETADLRDVLERLAGFVDRALGTPTATDDAWRAWDRGEGRMPV